MRTLALWLSLFSLTGSVHAQARSWVVGPGGFPDLQSAFDSPQVTAGDIVIVRPGAYASAVLRKGLVVRADPGAMITAPLPFPAFPPERLALQGITAPEHAVVSGFRLEYGDIAVSDCTGLVLLEDVTAVQPQNPNSYYPSLCLEVARSNWVTVVRLRAVERSVTLTDSNVVVDECFIDSLDGWTGFGTLRPSGGPGIAVLRTSMSTSASMISGAHIIAGSLLCGSPGLNLVDSFVGATSDTSIFGGGSILTCSVPGISFAGTGALVLDPSTVVRSASSSVPPIIGVMPIVRPVPSLTASTFVLGVLAGGTVQAQASGLFAVVIGTAAPPQFVPFLDGALGLDLTLPIVAVAGGNVGANGSATWALALPNLPLLAGQVVGLQAIAGQSQLKLTNPIVRSLR